ncbi:winged helix-turn-helix domain-containing protein [Streptomyces sp. NPDC098077]|uniref:winged helix-turn-helix domain-containing protein n=1 Tax=Streptomyces sp. NPDC098077 TaxID=3366093 RepID=UPI00382C68BF
MVEAVETVLEFFDVLEAGLVPRSLAPYGEPRLGSRGLYGTIGGRTGHDSPEMVHLWVMGLADGEHDVTDIAERSGLPLRSVLEAIRSLKDAGLIAR